MTEPRSTISHNNTTAFTTVRMSFRRVLAEYFLRKSCMILETKTTSFKRPTSQKTDELRCNRTIGSAIDVSRGSKADRRWIGTGVRKCLFGSSSVTTLCPSSETAGDGRALDISTTRLDHGSKIPGSRTSRMPDNDEYTLDTGLIIRVFRVLNRAFST